MKYNYDFHIHSCLSPCGDNDMTPNNLVNMAKILGADIIAVSDHNSLKNVPACSKIGDEIGLLVVPSVELCTLEEAHILCLFDSLEGAMNFDKYLYDKIPDIKNKEKIFGSQHVMNENDEIIGTEDKLLITGANISAEDIVETLKPFGGIAIPAHVDKVSYSLMASLGDIPIEYGFKTIEISPNSSKDEFYQKYPYVNAYNVITNSDAHYLENMSDNMKQIDLDELSIKAVINKLR